MFVDLSIFGTPMVREVLPVTLMEIERVGKENPSVLANLFGVSKRWPEQMTPDWLNRFFFAWKTRAQEAEELEGRSKPKPVVSILSRLAKEKEVKMKKLEELQKNLADGQPVLESAKRLLAEAEKKPQSPEVDEVSSLFVLHFFFFSFLIFLLHFISSFPSKNKTGNQQAQGENQGNDETVGQLQGPDHEDHEFVGNQHWGQRTITSDDGNESSCISPRSDSGRALSSGRSCFCSCSSCNSSSGRSSSCSGYSRNSSFDHSCSSRHFTSSRSSSSSSCHFCSSWCSSSSRRDFCSCNDCHCGGTVVSLSGSSTD